jgi:predicted nucleic acid-binding protein
MSRQLPRFEGTEMPNRYYWDANVFLEYLHGNVGTTGHLTSLLESATKKECTIYTSVLSITEVAFAAEDQAVRKLSDKTKETIESLWDETSPITLIEFHRLVAEDARTLIRAAMEKRIGGVRTADYIHIATALRLDVDELHTYENESTRKKWTTVSGLLVCEPISSVPKLAIEH